MYDPENPFVPEMIDQQIEQPDASLPLDSTRLVHELQAMYNQERSAAIDRVWERMAHKSSTANPRSEEFLRLHWQHRPVRSFPIQQIDRTTKTTTPFVHALSLVAVALICLGLVGGLALLLAVQRNTALPGIGASNPTPITRKGTETTKPVIPAQCQDPNFNSEQTLCATGQETTLNITKTFGSHKVTFVRGYADSDGMILVYKIPDKLSTDAISFASITFQQGLVIGDRPGEAGGGGCFSNPAGNYCLEEFSMQRVPSGTTELHVQAIADAFSNVSTPLHFTIPFHKSLQKIVNVNQTITNKGGALTLKSLVFTRTTLTIEFSLKSTNLSISDLFVSSIVINGQVINSYSGAPTANGEMLNLALIGSSGSWEIQIRTKPSDYNGKPIEQAAWTFHVTVPK